MTRTNHHHNHHHHHHLRRRRRRRLTRLVSPYLPLCLTDAPPPLCVIKVIMKAIIADTRPPEGIVCSPLAIVWRRFYFLFAFLLFATGNSK